MKTRSKPSRISWRDALAQFALVFVLGTVLWWLAQNTIDNLDLRGITVGFDFLSREARFSLSDSILPYDPTDTFAWVFLVGLCNTLFLSLLVAVFSTILGFLVALGRRAENPLTNLLSTVFVDAIRNTPLIVLLLFAYSLVTYGFAGPSTATAWHGMFLTNRGLYFPGLSFIGGLHWDLPRLMRTNIDGGWSISPELAAAFFGLLLYSTAFSAEIIRGGIGAIGRGQWEAARALGLREATILKLVVLPQALRVIVPPMTSQYLTIVKNSTLALVVGYAEMNFVTATTINQTGQALEGTLILMAAFLAISLLASFFMNWLNRHSAAAEH